MTYPSHSTPQLTDNVFTSSPNTNPTTSGMFDLPTTFYSPPILQTNAYYTNDYSLFPYHQDLYLYYPNNSLFNHLI